MTRNIPTKGDQINLHINQPGLPVADECCESLLPDLEAVAEIVLDEYDLDPTLIKVYDGHTYASISADCPQCGSQLQLFESELDTSNGAYAVAKCECGWHGEAVYRLIDLYEHNNTTQKIPLGHNTSIKQYDIQPQYYPY